MGIFRSRTIFLIFGVFSFATGHEDEILEEIVQIARHVTLAAGKLDQEVVKYVQLAKSDCKKYGEAAAFDIAEKGLEEFTNCSKQVFAREEGFDMKTSDLDGYIEHFCPTVQSLENCIEPFLNSIKPCLGKDNLRTVNVYSSFAISVLKYACESNGERIKIFHNDGGFNCEAIQPESSSKCFDLLRGKKSEEPEVECKSFEKFESCMDKQLKQCNKPSIAEIGNHVVDLFYEEAGCAKILGSAASPTTVINSLLVIIGIAMLL